MGGLVKNSSKECFKVPKCVLYMMPEVCRGKGGKEGMGSVHTDQNQEAREERGKEAGTTIT